MTDHLGDGTRLMKDGRCWRIGTAKEVRWIQEIPLGKSVADAVPPVFEAYATLEQPLSGGRQTKWEAAQDRQTVVVDAWARHEAALLDVLAARTDPQLWWLAYLETGGHSDVVFPDAPRVEMYAHWGYVLVEAGPEQAAEWRPEVVHESLPDVMFPADRSWLVTTLWDDDWTCIGGSRELIDALARDTALADRMREVDPSMSMDEACPPGHHYF